MHSRLILSAITIQIRTQQLRKGNSTMTYDRQLSTSSELYRKHEKGSETEALFRGTATYMSALKLGSEAHLGNVSCKFHVLLSQNHQIVPPHARDFV
jgi:hypothetical protein